ncbi:hypothetical protein D3C76_1318840 [compost metagenome]
MMADRPAFGADMQPAGLKGAAGVQGFALVAEHHPAPHRLVADHTSACGAFHQQGFLLVVQHDPPALAPIVVYPLYQYAAVTRDGFAAGNAQPADQQLRGVLAFDGFDQLFVARAGPRQNNCGDRQSHEQFDQAEALLIHDVSSLESVKRI